MSGGVLNHHGFALDVTYAGYDIISKKIQRIVDGLKRGQLGKVEFFKSDDERFKGELGEIPLVVVGADGNTMRGLVNMFAEGQDQKIENHPVQFQIIDQVLMQCKYFISLAEKINDTGIADRVVNAYQTLKKDFEMIRSLKQKIGIVQDKGDRDTFHENLQSVLNSSEK